MGCKFTASEFVTEYKLSSPEKRFDMLFSNYYQFDNILEVYKSDVVFRILGEIEYHRSRERSELDVRVQHSIGFTDVVFSEVNLNETISNLMDSEIYEARFDNYLYGNTELIDEVKCYIRTRRELDNFSVHLKDFEGDDRIILMNHLSKTLDYVGIAELLHIDADSVKTRVWRLKTRIKPGVVKFLSTESMRRV